MNNRKNSGLEEHLLILSLFRMRRRVLLKQVINERDIELPFKNRFFHKLYLYLAGYLLFNVKYYFEGHQPVRAHSTLSPSKRLFLNLTSLVPVVRL